MARPENQGLTLEFRKDLEDDPIIVSTKNGDMFAFFAWDLEIEPWQKYTPESYFAGNYWITGGYRCNHEFFDWKLCWVYQPPAPAIARLDCEMFTADNTDIFALSLQKVGRFGFGKQRVLPRIFQFLHVCG